MPVSAEMKRVFATGKHMHNAAQKSGDDFTSMIKSSTRSQTKNEKIKQKTSEARPK